MRSEGDGNRLILRNVEVLSKFAIFKAFFFLIFPQVLLKYDDANVAFFHITFVEFVQIN